jgi:TctA family transporter
MHIKNQKDFWAGVMFVGFGVFFADGIGFGAVAMGGFGFAEVISNLEQKEHREVFTHKVTGLFPTAADFRRMVAPVLRGTMLGSALGVLPGGAALASFGRKHKTPPCSMPVAEAPSRRSNDGPIALPFSIVS